MFRLNPAGRQAGITLFYTPGIVNQEGSPDSPSRFGLPFDKPFDKLTVLSDVEGLTVLSDVEGLTVLSDVDGLTVLSDVDGLTVPAISKGN